MACVALPTCALALAESERFLPDLVSEIENVLDRAGLRDDDIVSEVLAMDLPLPQARQRIVDEFERRYVERALAQQGGSVTLAAAASGIALRNFQLIRARQKK